MKKMHIKIQHHLLLILLFWCILTDGKNYDVYISYNNELLEDRMFATRTLRDHLMKKLGYSVCIADIDIIPGTGKVNALLFVFCVFVCLTDCFSFATCENTQSYRTNCPGKRIKAMMYGQDFLRGRGAKIVDLFFCTQKQKSNNSNSFVPIPLKLEKYFWPTLWQKADFPAAGLLHTPSPPTLLQTCSKYLTIPDHRLGTCSWPVIVKEVNAVLCAQHRILH